MLSEKEIDLFVSNTKLGDLQSSEVLSQTINTISTLQPDDRNIVASSPFDVSMTSVGKETTLSVPEIKTVKKSGVSAFVFVKFVWSCEVQYTVNVHDAQSF